MNKAELLRRMELMSDFYFCIEERGYTREEAAQAVGLDFDPSLVDSLVFEVSSTASSPRKEEDNGT